MFTADEVFERYGLPLLLQFEGLYLKPYLCPAKIPTIGLGSTRYADGRRVSMLDRPISKEEAIALAKTTYLRDYYSKVLDLCPSIDTAPRMAAIVDFAYNLGVSALSSSTLRKKVNAGDWDAAKIELMKWNKAGGKVLAGLTKRRAVEASLL